MDVRYLSVPFDEKDEAKSLGAKWDAVRRQWFVPAGEDLGLFARWVLEEPDGYTARAIAPVYLVESTAICWRCESSLLAVTIAAAGAEYDDECISMLTTFSYIESIPPKLKRYLEEHYPRYYFDSSKMADHSYWMNHCRCGAAQGDFFLHSEPGGAFFPEEDSDFATMTLIEVKSTGHLALSASPGWDGTDRLTTRARRRAPVQR